MMELRLVAKSCMLEFERDWNVSVLYFVYELHVALVTRSCEWCV